jgi:hypothetical protein
VIRRALLPLGAATAGLLAPIAVHAAGAAVKAVASASASALGSAAASASSATASSDFALAPDASTSASASASDVAPVASSAAPSTSAVSSASAAASSAASAKASASAKPTRPEDDPRWIPDGVREEIGSSEASERPAFGERHRSGVFPLAYSERLGNQSTTAVWPFYFDRKKLGDKDAIVDRQSLYGLYYRRRSEKNDVDYVFPFWGRFRDDQTTTWVLPPVLWRDGPGESAFWLAPLYFGGQSKDGGYTHLPPLLTFTTRSEKRSFSLIGGLGFYDRTDKNVDWGVVPFVFGGSDGEKLTKYTLIPPLLFYHASDAEVGSQTTVVGPVYSKTTADTAVFDVFPLFFHNHGPDRTSTSFLPLFHASRDHGKELLVTPLFLRAKDEESTTLVTPFYSRFRGRTSLDLAGPIVPLWFHYQDPDAFRESWLFGPVYTASDPQGWSVVTPLFAHWQEYGISRKTWLFPTIVHESYVGGWDFDVYPLVFLGKTKDSYHSVVAPFWWDFESGKKRTTIAFPLFWRFRDEDGVSQLALNTYYQERYSAKGTAWDFYFAPVFHVGESPTTNEWDVLFGLVGYKNTSGYKQLKLFWTSIDLNKDPNAPQPSLAPASATKPAK